MAVLPVPVLLNWSAPHGPVAVLSFALVLLPSVRLGQSPCCRPPVAVVFERINTNSRVDATLGIVEERGLTDGCGLLPPIVLPEERLTTNGCVIAAPAYCSGAQTSHRLCFPHRRCY